MIIFSNIEIKNSNIQPKNIVSVFQQQLLILKTRQFSILAINHLCFCNETAKQVHFYFDAFKSQTFQTINHLQ